MQRLSLHRQIRSLTDRLFLVILACSILCLSLPCKVGAAAADPAAEATAEAAPDAAAETAAPAEAVPTVPVRDPITNHLTNWPQMSEINEDSAVLMDADNGAILYSLDRDVQRIPASITKIMTCLLVLENAQMDEVVTMTEAGMAEAYGGSSNISPILGEEFTVEQCLYMLMLKSANDIAAQLAEHVGGSVEAFVQMMNDRCASIGTTGTHFNNPNGLPGDNHYTTAMDMALIMQECLKNEMFRQIISTQTYTVPPTNLTPTERTYENHCKLIIESDTEHYYPYCIGGKTGYTDLAWRTLVSAAEKDGRTLICVTLHGSDKSDFTDQVNLYEYGFNSFYTDKCEEEAEGKWDVSGGVTIPVGMEVSSLTREETKLEDGSIRVNYKYEDNPVGSITKVPKKAAAQADRETGRTNADKVVQTSESAAFANASSTIDSTSEVSKKESRLLPVLLVFLVILLVFLAIVMRILHRKRELELEELRRKKRAAKRKGSNNRKRRASESPDREARRRTGGSSPERETHRRTADDSPERETHRRTADDLPERETHRRMADYPSERESRVKSNGYPTDEYGYPSGRRPGERMPYDSVTGPSPDKTDRRYPVRTAGTGQYSPGRKNGSRTRRSSDLTSRKSAERKASGSQKRSRNQKG